MKLIKVEQDKEKKILVLLFKSLSGYLLRIEVGKCVYKSKITQLFILTK